MQTPNTTGLNHPLPINTEIGFDVPDGGCIGQIEDVWTDEGTGSILYQIAVRPDYRRKASSDIVFREPDGVYPL